jgi:hypothetical protein
MGLGSRLANVFFSPTKTFESIARKPGWDWLVPLLLLVAMGVVGALSVAPKIDVDDAVRVQMERMEKSRPGMTDTDREKIEGAIRKSMEGFTKGPLRFVSPLFVVVPMFLVPLIYLGISAAWGKSGRYMTIVAGYAWVQMVQFVKSILVLAIASTKSTISILEINYLVKSNLGAFLDPETASRPLLTIATNVDLFEIWALVLGSIALSKTTRLSPKGAAATVIGLWLVWICVQLVGALFGAAFGG